MPRRVPSSPHAGQVLDELRACIAAVDDTERAAGAHRRRRDQTVLRCLDAGFSQRGLAESIGVSLSTMQFWINQARATRHKEMNV